MALKQILCRDCLLFHCFFGGKKRIAFKSSLNLCYYSLIVEAFWFAYNQVQNIVAQPLFSLQKYAYSLPIAPIQCWESMKIVWNCSDGCLVHLAGLKHKKSTLKLGEEGLCHKFCGWLSESQKLFWQWFTLADAFKHFWISLQISFILFKLLLQVSLIWKGVSSFDFIFCPWVTTRNTPSTTRNTKLTMFFRWITTRNTHNTEFFLKNIFLKKCSFTRVTRYNSPKNRVNWVLGVVLGVVLHVDFLVTRFCLAFALP